MRIRFTYDGKRRSGELVRFYHAGNGNLIAKIAEDGIEHPKSFQVGFMSRIESGPTRTDEEMLPLLKTAAAWFNTIEHTGNPLELLIGAAFNVMPNDLKETLDEALATATRETK